MSFSIPPFGEMPDVFDNPTSPPFRPVLLNTAISGSNTNGITWTQLANNDIEIVVPNGAASSTNVENTAFQYFQIYDDITGKQFPATNNVASGGTQDFRIAGFELISAPAVGSGIEIVIGWANAITGNLAYQVSGIFDSNTLPQGLKATTWRWIGASSTFTRSANANLPGTTPIGVLSTPGYNISGAAYVSAGAQTADLYSAKTSGQPFTMCSSNSGAQISANLGIGPYLIIGVRPTTLVSGEKTYVIRPYATHIRWGF